MTGLERHYRRLIALYPRAHRRRYQEEMLATLMDGALDGQRLPRWREFVDLLWNAARLRLAEGSTPRRLDARWALAGRIFAPLAALVFGPLHVLLPLGAQAWEQRLGGEYPFVSGGVLPWQAVALAGAWVALALVALTPLRVVAAAGAWIATAGHVAWKHSLLPDAATTFASVWPSVVVGSIIAVCLSVRSDGRAARRATGLLPVALFAVLATTFGASMWIDVMLADVRIMPPDAQGRPSGATIDMWGGNYPISMWFGDAAWTQGTDTVGAFPLLILLGILAVSVVLLVKIGPGIRGRVLALAAVPFLTLIVNAGPMPGIVLLPLLTFGIGMLLGRRRNNGRRLPDPGRAHDRPVG